MAPALAFAGVAQIEKVGFGSSVKVSRAGAALRLHEGDSLQAGDEVSTDANTAVDLRLDDETLIRIGVNSSYKVEDSSRFHMLMHQLVSGVVRVLVPKEEGAPKSIRFRMKTPEGTIGVRGTEFVVIRASGKTQLKGLDGEVLFGPADSDLTEGYVTVLRGFESEISAKGGPAKPSKLNLREYLDSINGAGGPFGPLASRVEGKANKHVRVAQAPAPAPVVEKSDAPIPPPAEKPEPKKEHKAAKKDWQTALLAAAQDGNKAAVLEALKNGAKIDLASERSRGTNALHAALMNDHHEIFVELLRQGADPNLGDENGMTPLMMVATEKNEKNQRLSVEYAVALLDPGGANLELTNGEGKNALQLAKEYGHKELASYLASEEAKKDAKKGAEAAEERRKEAARKK